MSGYPRVSVLTPTIPGREHLLDENRRAVKAQTYPNVEHIIVTDDTDGKQEGCARTMNRAARIATGEWYLPHADDDFLCPGGIATYVSGIENADVVYARPLVWGEQEDQFCQDPPNMPACALVRASLWHEVGGYNEALSEREDYDLWERLMQLGARFVKVTSGPTRVYRFHRLADGTPGNKSRR